MDWVNARENWGVGSKSLRLQRLRVDVETLQTPQKMLPLFLALLSGPFTGLFLWSAADNSAAAYCQLVNTRGTVSGDCYARSVDQGERQGIKDIHLAVEGITDGERVVLRVHGLFGEQRTWGTAIRQSSGFVLESASAAGIQRFQFIPASPAAATSAMTTVGRKGIAAHSAAQTARTLADTRADYHDLASRLPWVESEIARARRDSVSGSEKVAFARLAVLATKDSVRRERIDWKRGDLQGRLGSANGRLNDAVVGVQWATERIVESVGIAASMRAQMKRDSSYMVGVRNR
jgi:hypothetical protein